MKRTRFAVVPAYNEEQTILEVVQGLKEHVSSVIIVDDNSSDSTRAMAIMAGALVVTNSHNFGYEKSLLIGIQLALSQNASSILTFDADGQHPYESIDDMFKLIEDDNADIAIGIRNKLPRLSEKIFALYTSVWYGKKDILCGMKCYSSKALQLTGLECSWDSIGTFITLKALRLNLNVSPLQIQTHDRIEGQSRYGINLKSEGKILLALISFLAYSLKND